MSPAAIIAFIGYSAELDDAIRTIGDGIDATTPGAYESAARFVLADREHSIASLRRTVEDLEGSLGWGSAKRAKERESRRWRERAVELRTANPSLFLEDIRKLLSQERHDRDVMLGRADPGPFNRTTIQGYFRDAKGGGPSG